MKLAVIIPVYNAENTIRKAVKSIDTTHDVEIICINDGSTDRTKQVLTELQKEVKHLIVYHQDNQGAAKSRNMGLSAMSDDIDAFMFLDADDQFLPGKMDQMIQSLIDETNPSLIISFYPKFAVHPDHEATAEAVVRTVGRMHESDRPRLTLVAFSNDAPEILGEPDIQNDISQYSDIKLKAFEAHASQTGPFLKQLASPEIDGQAQSFLKIEPFWTYHFES